MRFLARLFLFFSIFYLLSSIFSSPAHAQYTNSYVTPNTDANVPANLHTYTQSIILEVLDGFTCQIIGFDPATASHQCLGFDTTTGKIGYVPSNGGAVGFASNMIASLYTPPIHTSDYVNYVASNFGLVKHTYAREAPNDPTGDSGASISNGIGFDKLTPLLGLWTTFRNLSYLVFVIIFIAIGFAIMLRVKIDPRTVMTIENQIPKIIIGLILVTFSYAIAGFLIDMMYVTTYLTVNIVASSQTQSGNTDAANHIHDAETKDLAGGNPFGFVNDVTQGGILGVSLGSAGGVKDLLGSLLTPASSGTTQGSSPQESPDWGKLAATGILGAATTACFFLPIANIFCAAGAVATIATGLSFGGVDLGKIIPTALGLAVSWIAGILGFLIIAIAILIALFRVWFNLLMAYVGILLDVVLAPFFIIAGVFPGSKVGFGSWLRDIGSNLLAFPVTVAMFLLAGVFMNNFATSGANIFVPPLIGNPQGTNPGQSPIAYLIALGMILLTPNAVSMVRELVKAPKNQFIQTIGQNLTAGAVPPGEGIKAIMNYNRPDIGGGKAKWRGVMQGLLHI